MDQNKTKKSRKYRFQVLDVTPKHPNANSGRGPSRYWRRRNARFQVIDLQTGLNALGVSDFHTRKVAQAHAKELNITQDGRNARKSTRPKLVFSTFDQISDLWAKQAQASARTRNGYFEGTKIWSYGSHYLAGELVKFNGQPVALVNSKDYSRTTSSHTSSIASDAVKAGALVLQFNPESNSTFGNSPAKIVKAALASIAAEFRAEYDQFLAQYRFQYWNFVDDPDDSPNMLTWENSDLRRRVQQFNANCRDLRLSQYRVKFAHDQICAFEDHANLQYARRTELQERQQLRLGAI